MQETERASGRGTSERAIQAREAWQERRLRSTRARLHSCGLKLIAERGYDKTTAQDIARAANVSVMTFFRHFPSKEDVVLGMPPDSDGIMIAEHALGEATPGMRPLEAAHAVLDAIMEGLGSEGLSDIALRLAIVHENPTLLKALYARIPRWVQVVDTLLPTSLRTDDSDFASHLIASAMVLYWVETMCEWSCRGGIDADAALLRAVAHETDAAMASLLPTQTR